MKTTLLKEVMETYIDWHQEINLPLMQYFNNEEGLSVLLARAGYYFPNLTTLGNLSALIELDRLKPVICALLVIENKTPLLRMAISLALLLKMQEAIPILITVFKEDRYNLEDDLIDLVRLLKALTISTIPEQDLLELHEQASIKHPENESLKLLHIGQLMRHDKTYKQGWAIIQTLTNDQAKRRCLIFLATIHKKGIDTSGWLDFIVSDTEDEGYYLPFKLQWIKTLGSREVIEPFLDLEQDNRVFSLLCTALEAPDEWQMLLPLLLLCWLCWGALESIPQSTLGMIPLHFVVEPGLG